MIKFCIQNTQKYIDFLRSEKSFFASANRKIEPQKKAKNRLVSRVQGDSLML